MVDLSKKEYFAEKVELPKEILYAKSIVDILIIKNRMYLYDSLNKAKFSFEFDVEMANTPKLLITLRLSREAEDYKMVKVQKNNNLGATCKFKHYKQLMFPHNNFLRLKKSL